ncbi:MAG: PsbP-related protein [Ferruginibacter sp.]
MQKILVCTLLVTLFTHAISFNSNNNIFRTKSWQQSWLSVTDSTEDITVNYPSNWQLKHNTGKALFVIKSPEENPSDSFIENINLIVRDVTQEGQLDFKTLKEAVLKQLSASMDSFNLIYTKGIKWNLENGFEINYKMIDKSSQMHINITQRFLYNDSRLFVCTYTSQGLKKDRYRSTAFSIMDKMSWQ